MRKLVYILFLSIIFFLTPACHHAGDEHEHEHHHDAVQYTAYGADFELFAEAAPFCVGEASEVTVHLTWLSNFKPLDSTQVKISLIVAGKVFTETLDHPEQPGNYKCHFTPTQAGCGEMKVEVMLPNRVSEVCCHHVHVAGSHAELHEHTHEHAHEHSHEHSHEHGEEHHHGHEHTPTMPPTPSLLPRSRVGRSILPLIRFVYSLLAALSKLLVRCFLLKEMSVKPPPPPQEWWSIAIPI